MKTFFKDLFEQAEADELEGMGEIKVVRVTIRMRTITF